MAERKTAELPVQDEVYVYDEAAQKRQWEEKPWKKDETYFKHVKINVLAATKMMKHAVSGVHKGKAKGGMPIEVMGLLLGRTNQSTLIIMDCVELPIEGSETKVVADDESVLGFMTRMQDRVEELRKDRFVGWYHSHPFDVGVHSNCFFSATDVNTQLMWQLQFGKWVGIVVDPLRSLFKQKVELLAFMAYPPSYDPPKGMGPPRIPDQDHTALTDRWGAAYNRYYMLKHSYFMGSLVRHNLEMMSRKHLWIRHLASSAIMEPEARSELPKRITGVSDADGESRGKRGKKGAEGNQALKLGGDIAIEQCVGHSAQLIKQTIFNAQLDDAAIASGRK